MESVPSKSKKKKGDGVLARSGRTAGWLLPASSRNHFTPTLSDRRVRVGWESACHDHTAVHLFRASEAQNTKAWSRDVRLLPRGGRRRPAAARQKRRQQSAAAAVVVPDLPRRAIRSSCCGNNSGKWALPRARRQDQRLVFHRRHPAAAATRSRRSVHRLVVERMRFSMCVLHPSHPFRGWVSAGHDDPVISSSCVFVCARAYALRFEQDDCPDNFVGAGPKGKHPNIICARLQTPLTVAQLTQALLCPPPRLLR